MAGPTKQDPGSRPRSRSILYSALLIVLGFGAYWNSLAAPFHFDDFTRIVSDPAIRSLWPIGGHSNRPVLTISLALNNALFGLDASAFRLTNVAIHVAAALLLYGTVRRTLRAPRFGMRFQSSAAGFAFTVAALWMLHPIQTQSVTYVWQRSESMMGLFFLATLYCTVRVAEGRRTRVWGAAAVLLCLLGLGTKEVMVAVFPTVLLYDGILLAPSFREAVRRRWGLYAAFGTIMAVLMIVVLPGTETSYGVISRMRYAGSQPGIILHYLRLAVWPDPLCFDYYRSPARGFLAIGPPTAAVTMLLAGTIWGLWKRSWLGVAGAWFFLILAPTSSFVVINDLMVEYRMYLPLAAVVAIVVVGGRAATDSVPGPPWVLPAVAVIALGTATIRRNQDYRSNLRLWQTVLEVAPGNPRAYDWIARALLSKGRPAEAVKYARKAVELAPETPTPHRNLAQALQGTGDLEGALEQYRQFQKLRPRGGGHLPMGHLLFALGRFDKAASRYRYAIENDPRSAESYEGLAAALEQLGRYGKALAACREALRLAPGTTRTWTTLGRLSVKREKLPAALEAFDRALKLDPDSAAIRCHLGSVHASLGNYTEARQYLEEALAKDPSFAPMASHAARAAASPGGGPEPNEMALGVAELAARCSRRKHPEVLANLARIQAAVGRLELARRTFEEVLALPELASDPARRREYERERDVLAGDD